MRTMLGIAKLLIIGMLRRAQLEELGWEEQDYEELGSEEQG